MNQRHSNGFILFHGDDIGLRLPPHVAPIQIIIIPIIKNDNSMLEIQRFIDPFIEELEKGYTVTDIIKRTSRNGNKYARLQIQDESGMVNGLFLDSNREQRFTDYLNSGKKLPKKSDITIIHGIVGDDVVFINKIFPISDKIYMKLSEIK